MEDHWGTQWGSSDCPLTMQSVTVHHFGLPHQCEFGVCFSNMHILAFKEACIYGYCCSKKAVSIRGKNRDLTSAMQYCRSVDE